MHGDIVRGLEKRPTWKLFEKNQSEGFIDLLNCENILA